MPSSRSPPPITPSSPPQLIEDPDLELLVYAGAPTNGQAGDDLYRAQAAQVLSFEEGEFRRIDIGTIGWPSRDMHMFKGRYVDETGASVKEVEEEEDEGRGERVGKDPRKRLPEKTKAREGYDKKERKGSSRGKVDMSEAPSTRTRTRSQGSAKAGARVRGAANIAPPPRRSLRKRRRPGSQEHEESVAVETLSARRKRRKELVQKSLDSVQETTEPEDLEETQPDSPSLAESMCMIFNLSTRDAAVNCANSFSYSYPNGKAIQSTQETATFLPQACIASSSTSSTSS